MKDFETVRAELLAEHKRLLPELNSSSPNAVWKLVIEVAAFGFYRLWSFFGLFKTDIEQRISSFTPWTVAYYREQLYKRFSYLAKVYVRESADALWIYPLLPGNSFCSSTQLNEINDYIGTIKPLGYAVRVVNPRLNFIDIVLKLSLKAGSDRAAVEKKVSADIVDFVTCLPEGEPLRSSALTVYLFNQNSAIVDLRFITPVNPVYDPGISSISFKPDLVDLATEERQYLELVAEENHIVKI